MFAHVKVTSTWVAGRFRSLDRQALAIILRVCDLNRFAWFFNQDSECTNEMLVVAVCGCGSTIFLLDGQKEARAQD